MSEETRERISKEEFTEWENNRVTKYIKAALTDGRTRLTEFLAGGGTLQKDATVSTDFIVGKIQGVNEFLTVVYDESTEEKRDAYGH